MPVVFSMLVNGACAEGHTVTDGSSSASSKRTGWIASLFASKPSASSNSSQESEEMSETDGGVKKDEHITVPAKGSFAHMGDSQVTRN